MGKKLPKSKKHKKLKFVDPYYKGAGPQSRGKKLLPNEPPSTEQIEKQEMCHEMKEFITRKNDMKQNKLKKRKKKKIMKDDFIIVKNDIVDCDPGTSSRLPSVVKQKKHESEHQFLNRLHSMTETAIAEAKVETKYNIKLVNVDDKGNAEYIKEVSENKKEKRKKYKERQDEKKRMKKDDHQFELRKEKVKFGEVVNAPPVLTHKPRKAPELTKPGKRQLALMEMFSPSSSETNPPSKKKYLKKLAPAKRKMIEDEQSRAIQLYRMLKNKKAT